MCSWRCRDGFLFDFFGGSSRQGWSFIVLGKKVRRFLREFWDGDKTREVPEVRTFVVEFHESEVLSIISTTQRFQGFVFSGGCDDVRFEKYLSCQ